MRHPREDPRLWPEHTGGVMPGPAPGIRERLGVCYKVGLEACGGEAHSYFI